MADSNVLLLTGKDFAKAAATLKCDIASIRAVDEVESNGAGFLASGKLKILFEGHWFFKFTKGKYAETNPNICHKNWTGAFYLGGEREYIRFNEAFALDPTAAMLSTSWGRYQIMGFNHGLLGFSTVDKMVDEFKTGEPAQLDGFVKYIIGNGLEDELQNQIWDDFAYRYNGTEYKKNHYNQKLQKAYDKFKKLGL